MSSKPVSKARYIAFKLVGFSMLISVLFLVTVLLASKFLTEPEQKLVMQVLAISPPAEIPETTYFSSMMEHCTVAAIVVIVLHGVILAIFFPDLAQSPERKQIVHLVSPKVGAGIALPALIALVVSFIFCPGGWWRLAVAAIVFTLARIRALKWLAQSGGTPIDEFDVSAVNEDEKQAYSAPIVTVDKYSGLRTRIIQLIRCNQPGSQPKPCYIAQVEIAERDLELIIHKGDIAVDQRYKPVEDIASLGGTMGWYSIVSNNPDRAHHFINTNTLALEQVMEWATKLTVNVPLNEPMIRDETPFKRAGVLTLIRDNYNEEDYFAMVERLDLLIEISKSLSTVTN